MNFMEAQFLTFQMNAMRAHAEIVSGAYKIANCPQLLVNGSLRNLTDEEKLLNKVAEMKRHIHHMFEQAQVMGNEHGSE